MHTYMSMWRYLCGVLSHLLNHFTTTVTIKFATVIIAAAVAAVASAKSPSKTPWNFPAEGPCVAACTDAAGKSLYRLYDDVDSNGPFFLASLSYNNYNTGTPNTNAFMYELGNCIVYCPKKELRPTPPATPSRCSGTGHNTSKSTGPRRCRL
ncbi:hypothetical protein BG005_011708 [Podila minutissima]|nr:hypothetical protein BG005_011708 [Podila minutissima]